MNLIDTESSFWKMVSVSGKDECWIWNGKLISMRGGKKWGAMDLTPITNEKLFHRIAWTLTYGAIQKGEKIVQKCGNNLCCNPSHLKKYNKLSQFDANVIRKTVNSGVALQSDMSRLYDVSEGMISMIIHNKKWKGNNKMKEEVKIQFADVDSLVEAEFNPRERTKNVKTLVASMEKDGFRETNPIILGCDGKIGDGHRRAAAAKIVGIKEAN